MDPPPRIVTLVLVTPDGRLVGSLAPFTVDVPWWPEVGPVVSRTAGLLRSGPGE